MKYTFAIVIILIGLLFSNCNKNDNDVKFEMAYEREFTIPAGLNAFETHYFVIRDVQIGSYLTANNVSAADLISINPGRARLTSKFSGFADYSFIREVIVQIFTDDENDAREVFFRTAVPLNTGESLDILPGLADVKDYFGNTKFNLFVILNLQAVPQQTIETRFTFSFLAK